MGPAEGKATQVTGPLPLLPSPVASVSEVAGRSALTLTFGVGNQMAKAQQLPA